MSYYISLYYVIRYCVIMVQYVSISYYDRPRGSWGCRPRHSGRSARRAPMINNDNG